MQARAKMTPGITGAISSRSISKSLIKEFPLAGSCSKANIHSYTFTHCGVWLTLHEIQAFIIILRLFLLAEAHRTSSF